MGKLDHGFWLRIGFAIFLAIWGFDRVLRADMWATESLMGHFYGNLGLIKGVIQALGVLQLLIALSFVTNYQVLYTSLILMAMLIVSTFVTMVPMTSYLIYGGAPIPAILFADHFPLLAGGYSIYCHAKNN